jgi:hypothetical protein
VLKFKRKFRRQKVKLCTYAFLRKSFWLPTMNTIKDNIYRHAIGKILGFLNRLLHEDPVHTCLHTYIHKYMAFLIINPYKPLGQQLMLRLNCWPSSGSFLKHVQLMFQLTCWMEFLTCKLKHKLHVFKKAPRRWPTVMAEH